MPEGVTTLCAYVFSGANYLEEVILPESLKIIGGSAFAGCVRLKSIEIPDSVTEIRSGAFNGCTGLTSIDFPASLTVIGSRAFYGCTGLTSMNFQEGITKLDYEAFYGCTGLKEVTLPDSITYFGYNLFQNCSNLRSINIPLSLKEVHSWNCIFTGCVRLRTVTLPEGMTVLPSKLFADCNYLRNIILPSTMTTIGAATFQNCVRLRNVEMMDGMTTIQNNAFNGCTNLERIYLPSSITNYGSGVFEGCTSLVVECREYSYAAVYCVNNGIPMEFIADSFENETDLILDREQTYYMIDAANALSNGYITVNLGYGIKKELIDSVSDFKLTVRLSSSAELIASTLRTNEILLENEEVEIGDIFDNTSNQLVIATTSTTGELSFCLKPMTETISSYALFTYTKDGVQHEEIIGCLNEKSVRISIQASPEVSSTHVRVSGVAPANRKVDFYVDGVLNTSVAAQKSGQYIASVTLPDASDYKTYTLTAKTVDAAGASLSASETVRYISSIPTLSKFLVSYGTKTYNAMLESEQSPTIVYEGTVWDEEWAKFGFEVSFEDNSMVDDVYVCSTRNGVTKRMEATWDETRKAFTVKDMFDPGNPHYIPGKLTVEYTQPSPVLDFNQGVDFTAPRYVNAASEVVKNTINKKVDEYLTMYSNTDDLLKGTIALTDIDAAMDFNILTEAIPEYLSKANAEKYGYQVMTDDAGYQLYLKIAEAGEDKLRAEIIDFGKETVVDFLVEGKHVGASMDVESFFAFGDALGYADTLLTWDNNRINLKDAKQAVLSSSMSAADKAAALKKLENAANANHAVVATMALQVIFSAAGIAIPFPCSMILPLIAMQNTQYLNDVLSEFGYLEGESILDQFLNPKILIDPSGYLYDIDTNERIQGAVVTAYWISYEEYDADHQPPADVYGTLWNAEEWNQKNPLISDVDGRYAWDVPEGWWRVKAEHADYETLWSDWLPVPPPQTEVNLGMKTSAGSSDYQFTLTEQTEDTMEVSISNLGSETVHVQYILAAYDSNGKMLGSALKIAELTAGSSVDLTLELEAEERAYTVKGFVLDSTTCVPLAKAWLHSW